MPNKQDTLNAYNFNEELVLTLNRMGYMFKDISEYGEAFVEYSTKISLPVLDIAAAYGVATLKALEKGVKNIIANDIEPKHLEILKTRVPPSFLSHLHLLPGKFPTEIDFPENSLGAILISHVLHFLNEEEIEEAISKLYKWLHTNGKIFVIVGTPYMRMWQKLIPIFEKRKKEGHKWPGIMDNLSLFPHTRTKDLPNLMHFFDCDTLTKLFKEGGFYIEKVGYIAHPTWPQEMQLDGRENVGMIARKT